MANASAEYILKAQDQTKAAVASVKRGFESLDKSARTLSRGLKGFGAGALALKAWGLASREADTAIQNLAKSNADFARMLEETNKNFEQMNRAGALTIEAQTKLNELSKDPAMADAMRKGADVMARLVTEVRAMGPAWLVAIGRATDYFDLVDKASIAKQSYADLVASKMPAAIAAQKQKDVANPYMALVDAAGKRDAKEAAEDAQRAFDDYVTGLQRAYEGQARWSDMVGETNESIRRSFEDFNESTTQSLDDFAGAGIAHIGDLLDESERAFSDMSVYADQAARNMQDAFADFLFDPFQDGLKGMLKGFLDVTRRMVAERAAAQIFGSKSSGGLGFGDFIGAALDGLFGGAKAAAGGGLISESDLMGFAGGGSFKVGGSGGTDSQLVAFRATPGERVSVRTPAQSSGAVVNVYQNVDARGATVDAIKLLPAAMKRASDDAVARIQDQVKRGRL